MTSPTDASTADRSPLPAEQASARQLYQRELETTAAAVADLENRSSKLVWGRTGLFLVALVCLVLGYFGDQFVNILLTVGWLAFVGFFYAIVRHEQMRVTLLQLHSNQNLFQHLLARLDRRWDEVPTRELLPEFASVGYADDLDIGGPASLLSLVSLAGTMPGRQTLQRWITTPPKPDDIADRQLSVQRLVPLRDLRLNIVKTIRSCSDGSEQVFGLPQWAATENWLSKHPYAHRLSYVGPCAVALGLVLLAVGIPTNVTAVKSLGAICLAIGFLTNILVTIVWGSWIHDIFQQVTGQHQAVYRFAEVFESLGTLPKDDPILGDIRRVSTEEEHCAKTGFAKLTWNVRLANFQRDPTLYIVYLVLQLLFLWDFRVLHRLEAWKSNFGHHVSDWFEALGRCEALISMATLAHEYPNWCFPATDASTAANTVIDAADLGHPLLPDEARVHNNVQLLKNQPLLLVTGSNMAGKSTFMRAVGLNVLLARTGGPVCASSFSCPFFELATSIRVRDSLRDGVSFFMAELNRLKEVVDLAEHHRPAKNDIQAECVPILFLLDEILQGTNSNERLIAVASVLDKLLQAGAMGIVSTHDLDLATAEKVESVSQVVHFREYFESDGEREVMKFDYRMRPGPTPTTNALKLLKLVGLDQD